MQTFFDRFHLTLLILSALAIFPQVLEAQCEDLDNGVIRTRWLINRDMPSILDIEGRVFKEPWLNEDFMMTLKQRNHIGVIAERNGEVIGYMLYSLRKSALTINRMAVNPRFQREGVGGVMVDSLLVKLKQQRRTVIEVFVPTKSIEAMSFFRSLGFRVEGKDIHNAAEGIDYMAMRYYTSSQAKAEFQEQLQRESSRGMDVSFYNASTERSNNADGSKHIPGKIEKLNENELDRLMDDLLGN